jgi:hypothetical protein
MSAQSSNAHGALAASMRKSKSYTVYHGSQKIMENIELGSERN